MNRSTKIVALIGLVALIGVMSLGLRHHAQDAQALSGQIQWLDHLHMLPANSDDLTIKYNGIQQRGIIVTSNSLGNVFPTGGHKSIDLAYGLEPEQLVNGVVVCYKTDNSRTFIGQIRLSQMSTAEPNVTFVREDLGVTLDSTSPVCEEFETVDIDPSAGTLFISLRLDVGDTSDRVIVYGLGVRVI
jgi:hypothetical protein